MDLAQRLNAALEGRYRIERPLGVGGMATVYLARDLRHDRQVALKVLKPELGMVLGAERFLAEIRTTANLQHPHILPLHDSGVADTLLFYTMPFVDGETLRERIDREGRLPIADAIRIAADVADALDVAHEQGIIHRDIKPSNILLSRGQALVADFGIARTPDSHSTRLTETGASLGTIGYMSPEQVMGDTDVDHRADIYSLGCVLFEMLIGAPPYAGRTALQVLAHQATEPVPSVRALRHEVSAALDDVVTTALAKDADRRFASAALFSAGLARRDVKPTPLAPTVPMLVVLPFANRSPDPDTEYFSDGLTDEVTSDLSRVSALRVISRNSAMTLKGTTKDTRTLARELGVGYVVTGTVRRAGPSLRITAELVDAQVDTPMWSEKFSGSMEDVFGFQEDISRQIVAALRLTLTNSEARRVGERPIADPIAYDCYLRASRLMYNWTPDAQIHAVRLVDEAIAIVGRAPLLLAMKGQLAWNLVNVPLAATDGALDRAERLVGEALAIDADCPLAIFVRGLVAGTRGQPELGLVDLRRACELQPGDANMLVETARYSLATGAAGAKQVVDRLVSIDPLTPQTHLILAMYLGTHGPREEAAAPAHRAIELAPDNSWIQISAAWWIAISGRRIEAARILDLVAAGADDLRGAFATFLRCALEGDEAGALRVGTEEMEGSISNEWLLRFMADGWALLGRKREALRALRAAMKRGFINPHDLASGGGFLGPLVADAEYQALLASSSRLI
ncbi:protein kinase domain-containing protein [Gemmatimonas sp.]|uniref:protein kinase domain-containing protein n=1 Tax=Gemmatimonas sp. TaxID=1962908 RepID=UPI0039830E39